MKVVIWSTPWWLRAFSDETYVRVMYGLTEFIVFIFAFPIHQLSKANFILPLSLWKCDAVIFKVTCWWWTGRLGVLQSMRSQELDTTEQLNWTELNTSLVAQTVKNLPEMGETGFDPWVGKIPWRRTLQFIPVLLPGESHGQRSLAGYSHGVAKGQTWLSITAAIL